jgi:hypothetical protein
MPGQFTDEIVGSIQDGHAFLAPFGITIPTTEAAAYPAGWEDVGLVEEAAGIKLAASYTLKDIGAWTFLDPVRKLRTARTLLVTAGLRQFTGLTLDAVMGVGAWSVVSSGHYRYDFRDATPDPVSFGFDFLDTYQYRVIVTKAIPTEMVDLTFIHTDTILVPLGLTALKEPGQPLVRVLTSDPAFSEAGS